MTYVLRRLTLLPPQPDAPSRRPMYKLTDKASPPLQRATLSPSTGACRGRVTHPADHLLPRRSRTLCRSASRRTTASAGR